MSQASAVAAPGVLGPGASGFKPGMDRLRERMRGLGFSYEIAIEVSRRYPVRPRQAYRLAWGWTPDKVAERLNELAAREGTDLEGRAGMSSSHLCELERVRHEAPCNRVEVKDRHRRLVAARERVQALAEERGLSLREPARRVPCDASHLSKVVHGRKRPSARVAARLDDALDASGGSRQVSVRTIGTIPRDGRLPAQPGDSARVCGSRRKTRLSGYNPGTMCSPCERALFDRQHLADPGDDLAAWVWDTGPMCEALARLDFQAVLVIYRAAAGVSRRELGVRAGLSESVRLLTAPRSRVPHHGPVGPDRPVECLLSVLSMRSFNPLSWARDAPFDPPRTVGDVVDLYTRHQFRLIRGLGPRRTSEIEAALVLAGLDLAGHQERPRAGRTAARPGAPSAAHAPEDPCPQEPQP